MTCSPWRGAARVTLALFISVCIIFTVQADNEHPHEPVTVPLIQTSDHHSKFPDADLFIVSTVDGTIYGVDVHSGTLLSNGF
jgi:hypothetical protein